MKSPIHLRVDCSVLPILKHIQKLQSKQLYFKVYQSIDDLECGHFVEEPLKSLSWIRKYLSELDDESTLPPVLIPVMLTEEEFKNLPDFEGY